MMSTLLQEKARELLDQNEVSLIIGYGEFFRRANDKSLQRIISPIFISKPDEATSLTWNEHCVYNLSTYLIRKEVKAHHRIALVAKGCDVKSICVLIQENQIKRDNLVIIGLTCQGVAGNSPQGYAEKCYSCQSHNPPIYDILIPSQNRPQEGLAHAPLKGEKRGCAENWPGSRQGKTDRPEQDVPNWPNGHDRSTGPDGSNRPNGHDRSTGPDGSNRPNGHDRSTGPDGSNRPNGHDRSTGPDG